MIIINYVDCYSGTLYIGFNYSNPNVYGRYRGVAVGEFFFFFLRFSLCVGKRSSFWVAAGNTLCNLLGDKVNMEFLPRVH